MAMRDRTINFTGTIIIAFLIVYALIILAPLFWMVFSSLKTNKEFLSSSLSFPKVLHFANYLRAVSYGVGRYFLNSIIVTSISLVAILFLSSLASYAFARLKFRGNTLLFFIVISGWMVAPHITLIPLYKLFAKAHILDTYLALICPYVTFGLSFSVLLLRSFFSTFPIEIEDAAKIDGCNHFQIFLKILIPCSWPALGTVAIFQGLFIWNDFLFALIFMQKTESMTLPVGLVHSLLGPYISDWTGAFAAMTLAALPMVVMYIVFQKYFIRSFMAGAIKG